MPTHAALIVIPVLVAAVAAAVIATTAVAAAAVAAARVHGGSAAVRRRSCSVGEVVIDANVALPNCNCRNRTLLERARGRRVRG